MFLVADEATVPVVIAGRALADYRPMVPARDHDHSTTTGLVGYVVRETIRNGEVLRDGDRVGVDIAAIAGGPRYAETFPLRDAYRNQPGGYAVVDSLYGCGCRGGN